MKSEFLHLFGAILRRQKRVANLKVDQRVRVSVEGRQVIITPVADTPQSLEERLARFDPARHGGEAMASQRNGAEKW
jgi:antitoxin MazE